MGRVQHMVVLRFKPEVSPERIDELIAMAVGLKEKIDGLEYASGGPYSSPEGFQGGYTHGFLMTFRDAAARDAYLPHPEHDVVRSAILEALEEGCAFDFEEK